MKSLPDLCVAIEQGLKCGVYGLQMGLVFKTNPSSPEVAGNIQEPGVRKLRICFIPASTWTRMTLPREFPWLHWEGGQQGKTQLGQSKGRNQVWLELLTSLPGDECPSKQRC